MTSHSFTNALLLAEDESLLALDRQILRRMGVPRPVFFSSGRKALDHLAAAASLGRAVGDGMSAARHAADMLICHERLADMSGLQFLAYVRGTPGLSGIPALLLVGNRDSAIARAALACNSCAVLCRPYTENQAASALAAAVMPDALHAPLALPPSFAATFRQERRKMGDLPPLSPLPLSRTNGAKPAPEPAAESAEALFRAGFAASQSEDWSRASELLKKSHSLDPLRPETCVALNRVSAAQGREEDARIWLCRAGAAYLRRGDRTRAREVFIRLPRGKSGQTPLLREAASWLESGEVKVAALIFMEAHALDPDTPLHAVIGRACLFTPAPEEHMRHLVQALVDVGHASTAGRLHSRLLREEEQEEPAPASGFLHRFPVLHDILSVAGYTFKAWRTAA